VPGAKGYVPRRINELVNFVNIGVELEIPQKRRYAKVPRPVFFDDSPVEVKRNWEPSHHSIHEQL
jgi:hypothetical protein